LLVERSLVDFCPSNNLVVVEDPQIGFGGDEPTGVDCKA